MGVRSDDYWCPVLFTIMDPRTKAISNYRKAQLQHAHEDQQSKAAYKEYVRTKALFDKTQEQIKAIQSYGQEVGDVIRQITPETCLSF